MALKMSHLLRLIIILISIRLTHLLIASNSEIMTGKIPYICAFFRPRDYSIDDLPMPEILTFCSCTIIHENWAITSRLCFVQMDWYLSPINKTFTDKLPDNLHTLAKIRDVQDVTLVKFTPKYDGELPEISNTDSRFWSDCYLFGFSTPNNLPVYGNNDSLIYKIWHMQGDLLRAKVSVMNGVSCVKKHGTSLSEYKIINRNTMCIDALPNNNLEPCSFDRGAPIFCSNKLQGILVYQRPLPKNLPLHLPTGCYGNINTSFSIYAEVITPYHCTYINKFIKQN